MIQKVILPQLGQTMEEGTVEKWRKKEGDEVKKGEVLFELTTDKATLEVESFAEGILKKILVEEGATVPVNQLVAVVGAPGDELPEDLGELAEEGAQTGEDAEQDQKSAGPDSDGDEPEAPGRETSAGLGRTGGRVFTSPRARTIAKEHSVSVQALQGKGTGPGGRVIERDIKSYLTQLEQVKCTPAAKEAAREKGVDLLAVEPADGTRVRKEDVLRAAEQRPEAAPTGGEIELSAMRQTIAARMSESKQSVPHFYMVGQINMRAAMERRTGLNEGGAVHITVTDMLVKATAAALRAHPRMNARFEGEKLVLNGDINVGVAVAVEDGLFVPVIRNADDKPLSDISSELKSLAARAREGQLRPDQYEGGCVTISNLGAFGIDYFLPIINPPESMILGIGAIREEIVVQDGNMRIEPMMKVSVSADHRVTDGAAAAAFFNTLREMFEDPGQHPVFQ